LVGPSDGVCTAAAWSPDGKWMYLNTNSGGTFHIWRQRFPGGVPEQITSGPTEEEGIAVAPDGKSLVTSAGIRRSSVWVHDAQGDRAVTSEATAELTNPGDGSPFSADGKKLYYVVNRGSRHEHRSDQAVGELWVVDLQSGATEAVLPGLPVVGFSISPDGRDIAFTIRSDEGEFSIWLAPLDRSSPPRIFLKSAQRPRYVADWIYYVKRVPAGFYLHRIHADGSGDEQIWDQNVYFPTFSPDGRYFSAELPMGKTQLQYIVDWKQKRVVPISPVAQAYWSDDGRSFIINAGAGGKRTMDASTYVISLPPGKSIPELPPNGVSDVSELAGMNKVRVLHNGSVALSRNADTYAYVKDTVQRNLYRIPLR
jgi:Tol biopolymer transport system component